MNNLTQLSGKLYPDKSFTIGIVPRKKARSQDRQYERSYREQPETDYGALADWYEGTNSIEGKYQSISERPLFIKSLESSPKVVSSYGKNGITLYGKRITKNACIVLTEKWGRDCLGFGTCTLPEMHSDALKALLGNWGEVVRRFFQKIKRLYKKLGCPFYYVGCTEIQPKRLERTGVPVPHLHFVYVSRFNTKDPYILHADEDYELWNEAVNEVLALAGFLPLMGEFGHVGSFKLERIKSSASAYLGKYVSKGVKEVERMKELGYNCFPKQWWFASMHTKLLVMSAIVRLTQDECKALFYGFEHYLHEGAITWGSFVDICIGGEYRTMGLVGVLSSDAYICFRDG